MKKFALLFIAALIAFMQIAVPHTSNGTEFDKSRIYRLHIIANSDSYADQSVKLAVRDAILKYEKSLLSQYNDANCASYVRALLMKNAYEINSITLSVLDKNGFDYGAKISTGVYDFPNKTYNDELYPAGKYNALRVVLGDGKGENWWCVMFPPLCIIDDDTGKSEHMEATTDSDSTIEFRSIFSVIHKWFVELFD